MLPEPRDWAYYVEGPESPYLDDEEWAYCDMGDIEEISLTNDGAPEDEPDELGDKEVAKMDEELLSWAGDVLVGGKVKGVGHGREVGPALSTLMNPATIYGFKFEFWKQEEID